MTNNGMIKRTFGSLQGAAMLVNGISEIGVH